MRAVDEHPRHKALVRHGELQYACKGVLRLADRGAHFGLDGGRAAGRKGMREADCGCPAGGDDAVITDSSYILNFVDLIAVDGIDEAVHRHIEVRVVEQLAGDVHRLILYDQHGVALGLGDAGVYAFARPDGGRDGYLPVGLCDAQVVIGIVVARETEGEGAVPAAQRLTRGDKAAVDYDLDRHISAVGWIADFSDDLYGFLLPDDGAHHVVIEGIEDG